MTKQLLNRPLPLLLFVGFFLGLNFPLGKLAMAAGVDPAIWAAMIALGAGLAMLFVSRLRGGDDADRREVLRFALISGFLSYVVPSLLTYLAISRIGSGLAAIMFALSPVVTAALSIALRVRPPKILGLLGIALGLLGALVIILARGDDIAAGTTTWILLALLIPLFLGVGNVYRTLAWPAGASPEKLAAMTNLAAVPPLVAITLVLAGKLDLAPLAAVPELVVAQLAVSTAMFLMFFRLQQVGGPTYLSQIGYVAAAVGVLIGVTLLGETYPPGVWAGTAIIASGIALSTLGQFRTG